jgi:arylsulfatase A
MSGGKAAFWKDTEIADTFTGEATAFIARNKAWPFFLYFAPHDVHAPTIPHPRFLNTSGLGKRADMLLELDWSVGELMKSLDAHALTDKTMLVFSSDNGAYKTDEQGHRPNGPWRGEKSQLWEGGIRGPLLVRWPGRIAPGVSDALVGLIDLTATMAAIAGETLTPGAAPDSFSLLPLLLGKAPAGARDHLILMSGKGDLAIRQGQWKYIPDLATADGWKAGGKAAPGTPAKPGLYDLAADPGEKNNLHAAHPEISARLASLLQQAQSAKSTRPL